MKTIQTLAICLGCLSTVVVADEIKEIEQIIKGLSPGCIEFNPEEHREETRIKLSEAFPDSESILWKYIDSIAGERLTPSILRAVESAFDGLRLGFETETSLQKSRDILRQFTKHLQKIHEFPPDISRYKDPDPKAVAFGFGPALTPEGREILRLNFQRNQLVIETLRMLNAADLRMDDELVNNFAKVDHSLIQLIVKSRNQTREGANKTQ